MSVLKIANLKMSPNENIMFGVIKCLSQVITKFDSVFAGSSPNENENAHSPNVPVSSPKSEVIYEKSSSENYLEKSVSKKLKKMNSWRLSLRMKKTWK